MRERDPSVGENDDRTAQLGFVGGVVADADPLPGHRDQRSPDEARADQLVEGRELRPGPEVRDAIRVGQDLEVDPQAPAELGGIVR